MPPRYSSGVKMVASIHGSSMSRIAITSGMSAGLCSSMQRAVAHVQPIDHRRRRRDQVEVELAAQALLDDLEVQQPKEATAEAEAQRRRRFHLVGEAGVVEAQLAHGGAQVLELRGVHREHAAEHNRLHFAEARQRLGGRLALVGDRVADRAVRHGLDRRREEPDFARPEFIRINQLAGQGTRPRGRACSARRSSSSGPAGASSACHPRSAR